MKICLVSQEYPPDTGHGGIATQTLLKAEGLARLGHDVHVVSHAGPAGSSDSRVGGVHVVRLAAPEVPWSADEVHRWQAWSKVVADAVVELDARLRLDLVEFADYGGEGLAYVREIRRERARRPRVVIHAQGPLAMLSRTIGWPPPDDPLRSIGEDMEGECLRRADAVYASSRCTADWISSVYDVQSQAVLHSGVDLDVFAPPAGRRQQADRVVVLFVGRLAKSKGIFDLVSAAAQLASTRPGLAMRMVGPAHDTDRAALARLAQAGGLRLDMVGRVEREALTAEYGAADIFASPSHYESGPGFTFLEAMACGLPVIGPRGSGIEETVVDGDSGLLVPPGDVDAIAGALKALVDDSARRRRMGDSALLRAEEIGRADRCVSRIAALYESIVHPTLVAV